MDKKSNKNSDYSALASEIKTLAAGIKKSNKIAAKHYRLAKHQYQQSALNYELAERQYLIEKSALQPRFRLSVSEFLTCEPDFVNDPEQASEAKFLSEFGVANDQRALRIKVHVKGDAPYMRPQIVIKKLPDRGSERLDNQALGNDRIYKMTESTYFIDVASMDLTATANSTVAYFVYRDRTTLPVLHKYRLRQRQDSALLRWDAIHLDTLYANSNQDLQGLHTAEGCAALFEGRAD